MPKLQKNPSWRTMMRRAELAKSPRTAKKLREQALAMRREERKKAKGPVSPSGAALELGRASIALKSAGVAKAVVPMSGETAITPFQKAMNDIVKVAGNDNLEAFHDILRDFAIYHRNDLERTHIETLKKVHAAAASGMVRSYIALVDGLGTANGGPLPSFVVIPGLMAARVYDALRDAGHGSDER